MHLHACPGEHIPLMSTADYQYKHEHGAPDAMPARAVCPIQRPGTNSAEPEGTAAANTAAANM